MGDPKIRKKDGDGSSGVSSPKDDGSSGSIPTIPKPPSEPIDDEETQ